MGIKPFRVLADMSHAAQGYCGFAQESRVLFKVLSELAGVEPTGLIYGRGEAVVEHRFLPEASLALRRENQSIFLQKLVDGPPPVSGWRFERWSQRVQHWWRMHYSRQVETERLDNGMFWDWIWRVLLARSLSDHDIELAKQGRFLAANLGGKLLATRSLLGRAAPRIDTREFDFAIFHDSQPIELSPQTCKLIRYYDLIPGVRPDLVGSAASIRIHYRAIRRCLRDSIFVCNSVPTRDDLLRIHPELEERSVIIPNVLPDAYFPEHLPEMLPSIRQSRRATPRNNAGQRDPKRRPANAERSPPRYLVMAATIEPRKNHVLLVRAFERLRARHPEEQLKLVIVGRPGWKFDEATTAMSPLVRSGRIEHLIDVPTSELRVLYSHAAALVFPSLYEGFGYGPLEAMCCRTPAVVSDIAAHRWAYGDAALYFDPYSVDSLVEALERLLYAPADGLRAQLITAGVERVKRYSIAAVGQAWQRLFTELARQGVTHDATRARLADFTANELARTTDLGSPPAATTHVTFDTKRDAA